MGQSSREQIFLMTSMSPAEGIKTLSTKPHTQRCQELTSCSPTPAQGINQSHTHCEPGYIKVKYISTPPSTETSVGSYNAPTWARDAALPPALSLGPKLCWGKRGWQYPWSGTDCRLSNNPPTSTKSCISYSDTAQVTTSASPEHCQLASPFSFYTHIQS